MGKKGGWFSAIKRVFTNGSKAKSSSNVNQGSSDKRNSKEKRNGKGILGHGESKSFIPLFREPSSIEKILGEAEQLIIRPPVSPQQPKTPQTLLYRPVSPKVVSPKATSPRVSSARITSPKVAVTSTSFNSSLHKAVQSRNDARYVQRPELTPKNQHASATKIQAALRGYLARRNLRALRGLVRLQGVVRGQNVKRQTANAMKQMQLLVRIQTQIQSRRIQMLENQALQNKNNKETESNLSKWNGLNQLSGDGRNNEWDDSMLPREEIDARMRKKIEAIIKRERAMAYAYSHQLWKENPKAAQTPLDIRSTRFPWWWNWLERQLPPTGSSTMNIARTSPRPNISDNKASSQLHNNTSEKNCLLKQLETPTRTPLQGNIKHAKPRGSTASNYSSAYNDLPMRDNDSLTSCPPFAVPSYMNPTVSTKAKATRANSNPKERLAGTPSNESKRRFSFPLTPNIGTFKWNNKGFSNNDVAAPKKELEKNRPAAHSIGDDLMSIDSTVSMPAIVGRKPFNRFV